ncbi:hypothetical protein RIN58_00140 [Siccibacter colletis]|nr:hypothetical protein [Siccibacter colletis]WNN48566.1 hypothetical protein RIN58_00140 [Siccibacter colletis]
MNQEWKCNASIKQAGIYAGKGGFDVTVGEHTQLNGAVIGSTVSADKNRLDTGTLGFSDIHNQADYKVEHQSIGLSTGGSMVFAGNLANTMLVGDSTQSAFYAHRPGRRRLRIIISPVCWLLRKAINRVR